MQEFIQKYFLYAVVGATTNQDKFGYKVLKKLVENGFSVVGVNPKYTDIENTACYSSLAAIPHKPDVVVTIVSSEITEGVVRMCGELGIEKVWMQPGSESEVAISLANDLGIACIHHACIVVDGLGQSF